MRGQLNESLYARNMVTMVTMVTMVNMVHHVACLRGYLPVGHRYQLQHYLGTY